MRDIFHILESLSSARIEGNHTTLADYVESKLEEQQPSDQIAEIANIERAMKYIEEIIKPGDTITETLIRELHSITVNKLIREGIKPQEHIVQGRYVSLVQNIYLHRHMMYRCICMSWSIL